MKTLQKTVQDYLSIRRTLGYRLEREGCLLPDFASFLKAHRAEFITKELALEWATLSANASPQSWAKRLTMVRGLANYVYPFDPRTEIPPYDLLTCSRHRLTPYIYSTDEIRKLIAECHSLHCSLTPHTYSTLIGLLAVTGMRLGEAINLDRADIDWQQALITIRSGKFGKSREVPVHETTIQALRAYAQVRDKLFRHPNNQRSFFISQSGQRLFPQNVWRTFNKLRFRADITRSGLPKPRIHDLRHTFAVRTLLQWYQEGVDVERRIAVLSTYLGHVSPRSTYWYLTGTPELMAAAAKRLETSVGGHF